MLGILSPYRKQKYNSSNNNEIHKKSRDCMQRKSGTVWWTVELTVDNINSW